jgi:hypothetical protein
MDSDGWVLIAANRTCAIALDPCDYGMDQC